jgi:hypothetical protein
MAKTKNGHIAHAPILKTVSIADLALINPEGVRSVYSNNAAVSYSPHDFRIVFSEVNGGSSLKEEPRLELRANIAISPTQFKALLEAMNRTLEMYEAQVGKIAWPPKNENAQSPKMQYTQSTFGVARCTARRTNGTATSSTRLKGMSR